MLKKVFKHENCPYSYISVHDSRIPSIRYDEESISDNMEFILDNSYPSMGNMIFRQIIGVPIGVNPGPFIFSITLFYFECSTCIDKLLKTDYFSAKKPNIIRLG